jgi:hypothetical protein
VLIQKQGSRPAPLPHLRTFCHRTAPGERARIAVVRGLRPFFGWWLRGLGRPTPFFDDFTKAPLSVPHVLTRGERPGL